MVMVLVTYYNRAQWGACKQVTFYLYTQHICDKPVAVVVPAGKQTDANTSGPNWFLPEAET